MTGGVFVKYEVLWTGLVGQALRKVSAEAFRLATFLLTGPTIEPWGITRIDMKLTGTYLAMREPKVEALFGTLREIEFASFDSGWVYMPDLPAWCSQRWPLLPGDNRVTSAHEWYRALEENPFLGVWWDRHLVDLHLGRHVERRAGSATNVTRALAPAPVEFDLLGEKIVDRALPKSELDVWFERIAAVYPKREKLHRGRLALYAAKPTKLEMDQIWAALQWQVRQPDWVKHGGRYCPSLFAYFKDRRWLDQDRRGPRINESTADAIASAYDFINEEPPCTEPRTSARALPPPSRKSLS